MLCSCRIWSLAVESGGSAAQRVCGPDRTGPGQECVCCCSASLPRSLTRTFSSRRVSGSQSERSAVCYPDQNRTVRTRWPSRASVLLLWLTAGTWEGDQHLISQQTFIKSKIYKLPEPGRNSGSAENFLIKPGKFSLKSILYAARRKVLYITIRRNFPFLF